MRGSGGGRAWVAAALAALLAACAASPALAQNAYGELETLPLPPRAKPAAKPVSKAAKKPAHKATIKHVFKPIAKAAAKPAMAPSPAPLAASAPASEPAKTNPAIYPLPPGAVAIPEQVFGPGAAPTASPPIDPSAAAAPAPATTGAIAPAISPASLPGEPQPLLQARKAGVTQCLGARAKQAAIASDTGSEALSAWSPGAPDAHAFQSIALIRYPDAAAPRSAAVLLAVPTAANGCEGGAVQVVPSARSCAAIQAQLMQGGKELASLTGLPVIENATGMRQILLPAPGNGCVMISVGLIGDAAAGK